MAPPEGGQKLCLPVDTTSGSDRHDLFSHCNVMEVDLRFRVDAEVFDKVKTWLVNSGHKILAQCFESPRDENSHYHLYVRCSASIDAIRRQRTRVFSNDESMKGNGPMAISPMDEPQRYKEYMAKGVQAYKDKGPSGGRWAGRSPPQMLIFDKEVFDRTPQEYHNHFWETHVEFRASRAMRSKTYTQQIVERFEEAYKPADIIHQVSALDVLSDENPEILYIDRLTVINFVLEQYVRDIRQFDVPTIAKVVNLIVFKYHEAMDPGSYVSFRDRFRESVVNYCLRGGF